MRAQARYADEKPSCHTATLGLPCVAQVAGAMMSLTLMTSLREEVGRHEQQKLNLHLNLKRIQLQFMSRKLLDPLHYGGQD